MNPNACRDITADTTTEAAALDDPVAASLRTRHAHLARDRGRAVGYDPAVATFSAVPLDPTPRDWADLAALLGPGAFADLFSLPVVAPADWEPVFRLPGVQLVGDPATFAAAAATDPAVVELGRADVPEMLELAALTRPGPFWPRTHELGTYVGIRAAGRLVAMAGERLRPPGWTEISAVCTLPEARGHGLAGRLVRALAARIAARDERPFLHAMADNTAAIALYERLGFRIRREVLFHGYRTPTA
jgi:ribosomal protein S18 acetylase RimI-like enzyme